MLGFFTGLLEVPVSIGLVMWLLGQMVRDTPTVTPQKKSSEDLRGIAPGLTLQITEGDGNFDVRMPTGTNKWELNSLYGKTVGTLYLSKEYGVSANQKGLKIFSLKGEAHERRR